MVSAAKYNHMSLHDILRSVGWKAASVLVLDFISCGPISEGADCGLSSVDR